MTPEALKALDLLRAEYKILGELLGQAPTARTIGADDHSWNQERVFAVEEQVAQVSKQAERFVGRWEDQ